MRGRKVRLTARHQRSTISDTLPFEVPVSFSNRHFTDVLVKYNVRVEDNFVVWECEDERLDPFIRMLTGTELTEPVRSSTIIKFSHPRAIRRLPLASHGLINMPFTFEVCHKLNESRRLVVPHPLNQVAVADFYHAHAPAIIYFAGRSPFSIRRPTSVARYANFKDRTHEKLLTKKAGKVEEDGKEYDQIGSYFVYRSYSNIFKFFESYQYHRAEKRFNAMAKIDISRCFDSIYTHSLPWAIHGIRAIKDDLLHSESTFAGQFDVLMRKLNQNETNGIVIGPEFSRVFAELILQSIDVRLEKKLRETYKLLHRHNYEIFRYVDDYYIFYNEDQDRDIIIENLRYFLSEMKLHINPDKTKIYDKPIITEITIAKNAISVLLKEAIRIQQGETVKPGHEGEAGISSKTPFSVRIDSRDLIVGYKSVLKLSGVTYIEVGNYTFALLESIVDDILSAYLKSELELRSESKLLNSLISIMEFAFFIYASAPRVNLSIRITRIISVITRSLKALRVNNEDKHRFFKYVYDNSAHQLRKNRVLEFKEIENLYLLVALSEIGKEYWLEEAVLRDHLKISVNKDGQYKAESRLGYFTITVALFYMKHKRRYDNLRNFLINNAVSRIEMRKHYRHRDAELLMLSLDLLSCPFVNAVDKKRITDVYGLSEADAGKIRKVSSNWFTTWGGATITEELDAKRRREVY